MNELLPPLASDDYERLKRSIEKDGQRIPILVNSTTGEIIDGAHRLQICRELSREPFLESRELESKEAIRLQLSLNLARRQLSSEQKIELIKKLRSEDFTQEETAEIVGLSRRRIGQIENGSIGNIANASIPDLRAKLEPRHKQEIYQRTEAGEIQSRIAADLGISRRRVGQIAKAERKKAEKAAQRAEAVQAGQWAEIPSGVIFLSGDFREVGNQIEDESVDMIFTDPPYDEESIPLYGGLAELGARILKPGGNLICYAGHYALPDIFPLMTPHLRFWWTLACEHGGNSARLPGKWVFVGWKPMLWFVKDERRDKEYVADIFKSTPPDKVADDWQQGIEEAAYYIERLTSPGEVVLDPMMGSGTTILAAIQVSRRAVGIDKSEEKVMIAKQRIANVHYTRESGP